LQPLTESGIQAVNELAQRYGVSTEAVTTLLQAVVNGNGTMAQFNHWELGGSGQWMQGGMTMVGDMFNNALKAKVDGLCSELSALLARQPFVPAPSHGSQGQFQSQGGQGGAWSNDAATGSAGIFVPQTTGGSGSWWPAGLGVPSSSGGQNNVRYAVFPGTRRLAVEVNGQVMVYETLDHQIGGVSQQQGPGSSVSFTSQYGYVNISTLPVVSAEGTLPAPPSRPTPSQHSEIFAAIEQLAELERKGFLTPEEFAAKKAELLGRL
jgi:hypothetical protein